MNLELIEAFGPIIAALIAVGGSLLIYWLNNRQNIDTRGCLIKGLVTIVVLSALGVAIYFLWPSLEEMAYSLSEEPSASFTSAVEADYTPIPRGDLLMEINFAVVDEACATITSLLDWDMKVSNITSWPRLPVISPSATRMIT